MSLQIRANDFKLFQLGGLYFLCKVAGEAGSVGRAERLTGEWIGTIHSRHGGENQYYMTIETAMLTGSAEDKAESGDCGFIAALMCLVRKCLT